MVENWATFSQAIASLVNFSNSVQNFYSQSANAWYSFPNFINVYSMHVWDIYNYYIYVKGKSNAFFYKNCLC